MRGLRKYLTPFAPDQSGAVSVFYEFDGIIVICDAGGCTGNICGFDEQIEGYEYRKLEKLPKEIVMEKIMVKLEEEKQTWE